MNIVELSYVDLIVASGLVVAAGLVSLSLRLGLERQLAVAAVRTVVQLLLIGYILALIFRLSNPIAVGAILFVMIAAASHAAVQRSSRDFAGITLYAFITLIGTGLLTTFAVTSLVIGVEPWYRPQYVIPLLGMVLGNGLTGISLCLDTILERFAERRDAIEMELAHGATPWEAARGPLRDAVRSGMIPVVNSMMVVGIVSLPGMMTGQILANVDPIIAVKYQIVVMFMIAAATSLGCMTIAVMVYARMFNQKAQLRSGIIRRR